MIGISASRCFGFMPSVRKPIPQPRGDAFYAFEMGVEFGLGLMDRRERRAGKFKLAAGFKRDRAAALLLIKADDIGAIADRGPAEIGPHAVEEGADAAASLAGFAAIGDGGMPGPIERYFLVLGADGEALGRFRSGLEPGDKLIARRDRRGIRNVARHLLQSPSRPSGRPEGRQKRAGTIADPRAAQLHRRPGAAAQRGARPEV